MEKKKIIVMAVALLASMATAAGAFSRGDVNGDGVVNGSDVTALYNLLLDDTAVSGDADVNGDGVVNGSDVTALYNLLLNPVDNDDDLFAECYATLRSKRTLEGYSGEHSMANYIRCMWMLNELTTDEVHCAWQDIGISDLNHNTWDAANPWIEGLFMRLCDNIDVCNSYLARTGHDAQHDAEVRLLRAYYYYELMDLFGQVPVAGSEKTLKAQNVMDRSEAFTYIENEVMACRSSLAPAKNAGYGRLDQVSAHLLLARLYLNAEVYTGTARWAEARTEAQSAIQSSYKLMTTNGANHNAFQLLFMGDNDTNGAQNENVFVVPITGTQAEAEIDYSSTTFLVASTTDYQIEALGTGINQCWGGNRARKQFAQLFFGTDENIDAGHFNEWPTMLGDKRALFETYGHTLGIDTEDSFYDGFAYVKWLATYSTGATPSSMMFADTDFPVMRLAEAQLTLAEADARLNGGTCSTEGLQAYNFLRLRSGLQAMRSANLSMILNEWGREFGFEGRRRIDLVRYGLYGGNGDYQWEWKNGSRNGRAFDPTRNIFPIPSLALSENTNLTQNPGYNNKPADFYLVAPTSVDGRQTSDVNFYWDNTLVYSMLTAPASYTLMFGSPSGNRSVSLEMNNRLSIYMTPTQFFNKIRSLYDNEAQATGVKVWVTATVPGYGSVQSNVVNISLSNVTFPVAQPKLNYLMGLFTASGFDLQSSGRGMVPIYPLNDEEYDSNGLGQLEYVGYMPGGNNGNFLVVENPNEWFPSYRGDVDSYYCGVPYCDNSGSYYDAIHFNLPAGFYKLRVNTKSHGMVVFPYEETVATPFSTITIAGGFNSWSTTNYPMQPLTNHGYNHDWEAFLTLSSDTQLKFTNGTSNVNWGGSSGNLYGNAILNGENIQVPAGRYRVVFNDITGQFVFIDLDAENPYIDLDVIEDHYYLVGSFNDWSRTSKEYEMTRNGDTFSIELPASSNMITFKVAPQSAYVAGHDFYKSLLCAPTDEDTFEPSGTFAVANNGGAFKIPYQEGVNSYLITFDMRAKTYSIVAKEASQSLLWVVSDGNDWGSLPVEPLYSSGDGIYRGFAYVDHYFTVRSNEDDWNGDLWYDAGGGKLSSTGSNFEVPSAGYYPITLDFNEMTYEIGDEITSIGIIGEQTNWSSDFATLTFNRTTRAWEGTATISDNSEFKFRANGEWIPYNWGASTYATQPAGDIDIITDGYNIKLNQGGTYRIQFWALANSKAHCIFTKQ